MENFSLRAKKAIKRVSAVGIGIGMLGATISGAFAATLGDYPAPFVSGGKFQKAAIVIGANAGIDAAAATDVVAGLQKAATSTTSGSTTTSTVTSGVTEEVPIDTIVASSNNLDFDITDSDIAYLQDGTISFNGDDYDVSEHVMIDGSLSTKFATSISSSEDDYESDIRLEVPKGALRYFYFADQAISGISANIGNSVPLEIKFLNRNLKITGATNTSITTTVGETYFMNAGQSVNVEGKTVTLKAVSSTSALVDVDGVTGTVTTTSTKTINGLQFKGDSLFAMDTIEDSSASLIIGKTASKTYNNNDAYIGEDENDPDWKWIIAGIDTNRASNVTNSASGIVSGSASFTLGVKNDFGKDSANNGALKVGECVSYPGNYVSICYDSLSVASDKYMDLNFEIDNFDLTDQGLLSSSDKALHISTSVSEALILDADASWNGGKNISAVEKKTSDIYLYTLVGGKYNATMIFYYDNDDKEIVYAGNLSDGVDGAGEVLFAHIDYDKTDGTDALMYLKYGVYNNTQATTTAYQLYNVTVNFTEATDFATGEQITLPMSLYNGKIDRFGVTAGGGTAEGGDLYYLYSGTLSALGTKDEDHSTRYGVVLKNPESEFSGDEYTMMVPADLVQGIIKVGGTGTTSSSTPVVSSVAPTTKTDAEITSIADYNAVLVGGPCVNKHVAALKGLTFPSCGAASGFEPGKGVIELKTNGANMALIVAGWEADDTRRAGVALKYWNDATVKAALAGKMSVTVTGSSLELSGITVA